MGHTGSLLRLHVVPFKTFQPVKNVWALTKPAQRARLERQLHIRQQVFDAFDQLADPPEGSRRLRCSPPAARLRAGPRSNRAVAPAAMRVNQTDATAVRRREGMPSGFVNCAADDTAPFRLARMLRVGSNKNSPLPFLLANAHVAGCGWLGIHEADLEAFGFSKPAME